jgi:hypothetical protein
MLQTASQGIRAERFASLRNHPAACWRHPSLQRRGIRALLEVRAMRLKVTIGSEHVTLSKHVRDMTLYMEIRAFLEVGAMRL